MSLLASCGCNSNGNNKEDENLLQITYGRYFADGEKATLNDIEYSDFLAKMEENGHHRDENFLIATYDEGTTCSCWVNNFGPALRSFVSKYHYEVYTLANQKIGSEDFGLKHYLNQSMPTLAIVNHGSIVKQFVYNSQSDMFFKDTAIKSEVEKYIKSPQLFKVSQEYLDNAIKSEETVVYYMREKCGDCSFVSPEVLWPYAYSHKLNTKFLVFDMDPLRDTDMEKYNEFKKDHLLTSDESNTTPFGYGGGVVPTFQYWKGGNLVSASVYANDSIAKGEGDECIVTTSFYSSARKNALDYLEGIETTVLEGITISKDEYNYIEEYNFYVWPNKYAAKYHTPLLEGFLNKHA